MKIKRFIAAAAACAMICAAFAGCGSQKAEDVSTSAAKEDTAREGCGNTCSELWYKLQ